jgi:NTP pyrophosphatase (non-canonical NTP hydrolase)
MADDGLQMANICKLENDNKNFKGALQKAPLLLHNFCKMTIEQAQANVHQWITTVGVRYFSELTNMAILTEEVGELARIMARTYGDQSFKKSDLDKNLPDELADILWVVFAIANQTGTNLTEALQKNFDKKTIRDATRHLDNDKLK